jgi:hypothetical protein
MDERRNIVTCCSYHRRCTTSVISNPVRDKNLRTSIPEAPPQACAGADIGPEDPLLIENLELPAFLEFLKLSPCPPSPDR